MVSQQLRDEVMRLHGFTAAGQVDALLEHLRTAWAAPLHKTHDWRNHVPDSIHRVWATLDDEARLAVFITAERAADNEEWE